MHTIYLFTTINVNGINPFSLYEKVKSNQSWGDPYTPINTRFRSIKPMIEIEKAIHRKPNLTRPTQGFLAPSKQWMRSKARHSTRESFCAAEDGIERWYVRLRAKAFRGLLSELHLGSDSWKATSGSRGRLFSFSSHSRLSCIFFPNPSVSYHIKSYALLLKLLARSLSYMPPRAVVGVVPHRNAVERLDQDGDSDPYG